MCHITYSYCGHVEETIFVRKDCPGGEEHCTDPEVVDTGVVEDVCWNCEMALWLEGGS